MEPADVGPDGKGSSSEHENHVSFSVHDDGPNPSTTSTVSLLPHQTLETGTSDVVEEIQLPGEPVSDHLQLASRNSASSASGPDYQAVISRKRTLSSRVTPADIDAFQPGDAVLDVMQSLESPQGSVASSMRKGDQSPHRQWINGIWYAAQEVERRKEQQATELFEEKRKADSLRDVSAVVNEVRKQGVEADELHGVSLWKRIVAFRNTATIHVIDAVCSLFLIFVMDVYAISVTSSTGDDIMHGLQVTALGILAMLFFYELSVNRSRSVVPYLLLELLSILSFIPSVLWWVKAYRIKTADDLWSVKVLLGCARAGKIVRLAVTFPRIFLWRLDRTAKTQEAHFAAHTVKAHENQNRRPGSQTLQPGQSLSDFGRMDSRASADSMEGRAEVRSRSHISVIMYRQMVHHSVLMVCCFYGMLAGYEVLSYANDLKDVESVMQMLRRVHAADGHGSQNSALFADVSSVAFDRLEAKGLDAVYLKVNSDEIFGARSEIDALRTSPPSSAEFVLPPEGPLGACEVHFDASGLARNDVSKSLYLSCMSIVVIFGTTATMKRTLIADVIRPMERMIAVIAQLAQEPLTPLRKAPDMRELSTTFETKMVEMAIHKFASLLQLAFGEAGAGIIRENSSGGVLNQNMTGKVVQGIFGFCDVRNFTTLTEILQGDVVKIVNGIADIVHAAVCDNYGAPNKNVGDAFLLVWKPKGEQKVSHVAESSLRAYVRTIIHMQHSTLLSAFAVDDDVRRELHRRMPDLRLRLGFGLHYGWAVECAIGCIVSAQNEKHALIGTRNQMDTSSIRKIDASYLSPHVNLASRLEAGTKQYGVDILISAQVFHLFGSEVQALCRLVDRVTFKGSDQPICIYTYDVPTTQDPTDVATSPLSRGMSFSSLDREKGWEDTQRQLQRFFTRFPPSIDDEFRSRFSQGIMFYLGGPDGAAADWDKAEDLFQQCLTKRPHDGPSSTLLAFIRERRGENGSPGSGWQGFRHLDEK